MHHHWTCRTDIVAGRMKGFCCWLAPFSWILARTPAFHLPAFVITYSKRRPTSQPTSSIGWRCRYQTRCFFLLPPSLFHQLGLTGGLSGWALNGSMSQDASCPALRREHYHANDGLYHHAHRLLCTTLVACGNAGRFGKLCPLVGGGPHTC